MTGLEGARATAKAVATSASTRLGEPVWLLEYPAEGTGDIGHVVLGLPHEGVFRAVGAASDVGNTSSIDLMDSRAGRAVMRLRLASAPDEIEECGAAVARYVVHARESGFALNAFDVTFTLLGALRQTLSVFGGRFSPIVWGDRDGVGLSGYSVELCGPSDVVWRNLVQCTFLGGGVSVVLPAAAMGGERSPRELQTTQDLLTHLPGMLAEIREAIEGRATFRSRPFGIVGVGRRIEAALREAKPAPGAYEFSWREGAGFPHAWPSGAIFRTDELGHHACVTLDESAYGVTVTADAVQKVCTTDAELERWLPELIAAIEGEWGRLTPDKLVPGARYRVVSAFEASGEQLREGSVLRFIQAEYVARADGTYCRFQSEGEAPREIQLWDNEDREGDLLLRIHQLLVRHD